MKRLSAIALLICSTPVGATEQAINYICNGKYQASSLTPLAEPKVDGQPYSISEFSERRIVRMIDRQVVDVQKYIPGKDPVSISQGSELGETIWNGNRATFSITKENGDRQIFALYKVADELRLEALEISTEFIFLETKSRFLICS